MTIVFNLLCKAFIAILDILLLDFYIKISFSNIYSKQVKKLSLIYIFTSILLLLSTSFLLNFCIYLIAFLIISIIFKQHKNSLIIFLKNFSIFLIIKITAYCFSNLFCSWTFNTSITFEFFYFLTPYLVLVRCITNYISYIIFIFTFKNHFNLNLKRFKIFSILIFILFCLTFIIDNPALFRTINIARTYIFTVMISIIALICFDRMQTKYEKDKHLQESIIQNLEKEKEFNQQREQQQKEIRKINHNLNNILIILQSHLEKEEYEEAKNYIEQNLKTHVKAYQALTHTGIAAIDGALNAHIQSIKEKGIQYDEDISKILHLGSIVPGDLALIISLALDNAKEACENIEGEKHISLKLQSKQTHVILYIENSIPEGSHPSFHKTSKKDKIAHGFGVSSIKEMAERYHGEAKYEVEHDQVILRVVLQK